MHGIEQGICEGVDLSQVQGLIHLCMQGCASVSGIGPAASDQAVGVENEWEVQWSKN